MNKHIKTDNESQCLLYLMYFAETLSGILKWENKLTDKPFNLWYSMVQVESLVTEGLLLRLYSNFTPSHGQWPWYRTTVFVQLVGSKTDIQILYSKKLDSYAEAKQLVVLSTEMFLLPLSHHLSQLIICTQVGFWWQHPICESWYPMVPFLFSSYQHLTGNTTITEHV